MIGATDGRMKSPAALRTSIIAARFVHDESRAPVACAISDARPSRINIRENPSKLHNHGRSLWVYREGRPSMATVGTASQPAAW